MRASLPFTIVWTAFAIPVFSDCRHPNGNIQTDAYHAPCAKVLGNPLNTMCCAIERPNPPGGISANGLAADECLPNGLCKQSWRADENSTAHIQYYREECTVNGWKNGSCLSVCLSNSASSNVLMTPCDDTANSTRWCCGENKDCCAADIGVETLAQTFLGPAMTSTSSLNLPAATSSLSSTSPSSSPSSSSSSGTTASTSSGGSAGLSGGAIAGIVIGAVVGVALIFAAWFFVSRRRRNAGPSLDEGKPLDANQASDPSKTYYAYEADAIERNVSELPGTNTANQNQAARAHELQ